MSDELKSAYELALERLQAKDRKEGVEAPRSLSGAQKRKIARHRQEAQAKLAELEIMYRQKLAAATDVEQIRELEQKREIDRRRVESALESAIERARVGES